MSSASVKRKIFLRRRNHDKRLFKGYSVGIVDVYNKVIAGIRSGKGKGAIPSDKQIASIIERRVSPMYAGVIIDGIKTGLQDVEELYGQGLPIFTEKVITEEDVLSLGITTTVNEIRDKGMKKIVLPEISTSLGKALNKTFEEGTKAGLGIDKMATKFRAKANLDKLYKAKRIAQTETTRVWNASSLAGYEKSTVAKARSWVTLSSNPRSAHSAANGQTRLIGRPFIVGGESLMYPGDENGSPENVANCHCGTIPVIRVPKAKPIGLKT